MGATIINLPTPQTPQSLGGKRSGSVANLVSYRRRIERERQKRTKLMRQALKALADAAEDGLIDGVIFIAQMSARNDDERAGAVGCYDTGDPVATRLGISQTMIRMAEELNEADEAE